MRFSRSIQHLPPSAVREILKVAERPDILSFAGGLPAPELFPVEAIAQAYAEVLASEGRKVLQYSTTEGDLALRSWITQRMAQRGVVTTPEQILITHGSQQGIELAAKILIDPGDVVLVENPTYLAALQVFRSHQANVVAVESDEDGMRIDHLEELIQKARPKLIYLVTDFSNPKGVSLRLDRRARLVEIAAAHDVPILEDDPYGELRYRGEALSPLAAFDRTGTVIYLSTFSKTLAPGMRLGWLHGGKALVRMATIAKQAADLHTGAVSQRAAVALLRRFDLEAHLRKLRTVYGERLNAMLSALAKHMPDGVSWTRPEGGLFLWAELPAGIDADRLFEVALQKKVAFVPGAPFFVEPPRRGYMRLNFSNRPPELLEEGAARLAEAIAELAGRRRSVSGGPTEVTL